MRTLKMSQRRLRSLINLRTLSGGVLAIVVLCVSILLFFVHVTNELAYRDAAFEEESSHVTIGPEPFPLSVNPEKKAITEHPEVLLYLTEELAREPQKTESKRVSVMQKIVAKLAQHDWYQNLAAGSSRILVIQPGERREEVAENFGDILKWDEDLRREFLATIISDDPIIFEGKFAPGTYVVARGALPHEVAPLLRERFTETILSRYSPEIDNQVKLNDALTIASLLEREAYDFDDMRYIAGVIWNRLFIGMNLQIDATLQYAKGTASAHAWWQPPVPADKYIDSPYNTYEFGGLPPTPIANPSVDAVLAALNPRETECLYYFHDDDGGFHCSKTYEEHVTLLKKIFGRGK